MCGVAVCISTNAEARTSYALEAIESLTHRGPDGKGVWDDGYEVSLIHRRLAVQDLTNAGHQPMMSPSGRYVISFNGEIYNHLELRKRFLGDARFNGHSDTETLVVLFERLGTSMLQYLVGMWAICIWDAVKKELFVSRDRFGQKPLYWARTKESIFISSEIRLILRFIEDREPNPLAVSEYLGAGNYGHLFEQTFFQSVYSFLPASYAFLTSASEQPNEQAYWQVEEIPYSERLPFDNARAKTFRDLIMTAVESQLLSDVPVGVTLSGGLDSSIIVSCIAALGRKNFPAFTAQFRGEKHDESRYVEALKRQWGNSLDVIYTPVRKMTLRELLPEVIKWQEEPFGDPSIIAHSFLVEAARKRNIPVLLGGQGGDEISMGYPWMYEKLFSYALNNGDVRGFLGFARYSDVPVSRLGRLVLGAISPSFEFRLRMSRRRAKKRKLHPALSGLSAPGSLGRVDKFDGIYLESTKTVGLPHLCHYDDRSTMRYSVEGRMPFLDHRLLEFVSNLQPSAFYKQGYSKRVFRESFRDLLPVEILNRKDKIGFYTPVQRLLLDDSDWVSKLLLDPSASLLVTETYRSNLLQSLAYKTLTLAEATDIFRIISVVIWKSSFGVCQVIR